LSAKKNNNQKVLSVVKRNGDAKDAQDDDDIDEQDDFFAAKDGVSTEDIFTQVQNQKTTNPTSSAGRTRSGRPSNSLNNDSNPDKSRGFKTQNQSKRDYASFQHRNKRQKFI
jgi:hypothetical protein